MSRTQIELVKAVAIKLNVTGAAQPVSHEDSELIKSSYGDSMEEWKDRGVAYWSLDEIPNVVFNAVVLIVAGGLAQDFGMAEPAESDENGRQYPISALGWRRLKRHIAKPASGVQITSDYF